MTAHQRTTVAPVLRHVFSDNQALPPVEERNTRFEGAAYMLLISLLSFSIEAKNKL